MDHSARHLLSMLQRGIALNNSRSPFDTTMPTTRRQTPQRSGCVRTICRDVILFLAFLTLISGSLFLGLACYLFLVEGDLIPLLHNDLYIYCIYLLAGCGVFTIFNSFLVCPAVKSRCMMATFLFLMSCTILLGAFLLFTTISYMTMTENELEISLMSDLKNKYGHQTMVTQAIDKLQVEGKCCGAVAFNDWPKNSSDEDDEYYQGYQRKKVQYVPDSCCKTFSRGCALSDHPSNIYYLGCKDYFKSQVQEKLNLIIAITFASLALQCLIGLLSCFYCCRSRDEVENRGSKDREQELSLFD